MYLNAWLDFPGWQAKAMQGNKGMHRDRFPEEKGVTKSRESFSAEWGAHQAGDVTWTWDLKERLAYFAEEVGVDAQKVRHKVALDAGCGNGELTNGLTSWETEAVGIDLSRSVVRAEQRRTSAFVHYVQGNLLALPFKRAAFNLIYSSGVLHHTPYPRIAFRQLVDSLSLNGRIYIWLYGKPEYSELAAYTEDRRRANWLKPLVVKLPTALQHAVIFPIAVRFWAVNRLKGPDRRMSLGRAKVAIFDALTPYYRSHHHFEEVREWFAIEGLTNVTLSGVREPGFGVFAEKASA
jgi:SAM-dependent methyltransferase